MREEEKLFKMRLAITIKAQKIKSQKKDVI